VLVVLLIAIRFLGKRQIGGMNVYDLVLMLAVANAVQNAMTKGSGQLAVGLVSAGTLLLIGRVLGIAFVRLPWLEAHLVGTPTIILQDGKLDCERMRGEGVTEAEVLAALRQYGLTDVGRILLVVL